jgi:alcohol dehydrogenase
MNKAVILSEENSLSQLSKLAAENNWERLFFVTGKKSFETTGARDKILDQFSLDQIVFFNDFEVNPKLKDVYKGLNKFSKSKADVIVSIGGGTAIDMAKLINSLTCVNGNPEDYATGKLKINKVAVPHIAVPTTSGSGSEATHFAVVYVDGVKYSMASELLLPPFVILDPNLTLSLPPYITAYTTMDALCQAMESFWSVGSTEESSDYSLKAVKLILDNIRSAVNSPNINNRKALQEAANLAGKSINLTKTTAAHALSYFLTSKFDLPHGHAVGLMFGWVFEQNSKVSRLSCNDPRGEKFVLGRLAALMELFNVSVLEDFPGVFFRFMDDIRLKVNAVKFDNELVNLLFKSVNIERLGNNPASIDLSSVESFIEFFDRYTGNKES